MEIIISLTAQWKTVSESENNPYNYPNPVKLYMKRTYKQPSLYRWKIWREELEKTLQSKLVKREWVKLKNEFSAYKKFQVNVDGLINSKSK